MPGEPQEADFSLLLGLQCGLDRPARCKDPVGVVVVDDLVKLPEIEMVGAQPSQAVFQMRLRVLGRSAAAFGHQEDLFATVALGKIALPIRSSAAPSW